jgi:peptidyl-prolyl cis-trans isomerase A (cyclophilin A)
MKNLFTAVVMTAACLSSAAMAQTAPKPGGAPKAAPAKPSLLDPSTLKATAPAVYRAKFTTTKGDVIIEVTRAWAPRGADRFYNLVRGGFFTDAAFFRVIPGFMAQFGLSARPDVSAVWEKAKMVDDPVTQTNKRGMITFATAGPNTRTTQLFINFGDNARLDSQGFAPFGQVVEGMDAVDKISAEYMERPDQGLITQQGKAYLDRNFPHLDRIISASIVPATPPAAKQ